MALVADRFSPQPLPAAPELRLVPARRRAVRFVAAVAVLVVAAMLGAALLHTELAARQLELDRLERAVIQQRDDFDALRAERAELRSPDRLGQAALSLGMRPTQRSEFAAVQQWQMAQAIAATGQVLVVSDDLTMSAPLEQFRLVKAVSDEAP